MKKPLPGACEEANGDYDAGSVVVPAEVRRILNGYALLAPGGCGSPTFQAGRIHTRAAGNPVRVDCGGGYGR